MQQICKKMLTEMKRHDIFVAELNNMQLQDRERRAEK